MQPAADTTTLLVTGDVMVGRGIDQVLPHPAPPELYEEWVRDARDYVHLAERVAGRIPAPVSGRYLWGEALQEVDVVGPDATIINLETAVTAAGQPWRGKGIHYRMHPANVDCLKAAGVPACALANNHTLDWSAEGLADTLRSLGKAGLRAAGAGMALAQARSPAVMSLGAGQRLLVFSWAAPDCGVPPGWEATSGDAGIALLQDFGATGLRQVADAVSEHRREGELVVLSIHWGANWVEAVPQAPDPRR